METKYTAKSFEDFAQQIKSNLELQNEFKTDPVNTINQFKIQDPLATDHWIYRIVVIALGITILSIIIGSIVLAGMGKKLEGEVLTLLTAIGSAAIGALAGLLAPSPKRQ